MLLFLKYCLPPCNITQLHYYHPASLPDDATLAEYGKKEIKAMAQFYGNEANITYDGKTYTFLRLCPNGVFLKEHF